MAEKRNIVLITLDSVRADHCSFMGYHRKTTPTLDKMARKGLYFENAIASGVGTPASMTCVFTGDYAPVDPMETNPHPWRRVLSQRKTLAQVLSKKGYHTSAFNPNVFVSSYFGFNKGFEYFQDFISRGYLDKFYYKILDKVTKSGKRGLASILRNVRNLILKEEIFKPWEAYYDLIIDWIEKVREPYFLWILLLDTHYPYLAPRKFRKWSNFFDMWYYNWKVQKENWNPNFSEKEKQKLINAYDDAIYYTDIFISNLWKDLKDSDPIFIIHADHGEGFGEHNFYGHQPYLYEEIIHVPLVIYNADVKGRLDEPAPLVGLAPVILELIEEENQFPSDSFLGGGKNWAITVIHSHERLKVAVRTKNWEFITGQKDGDELYNLKDDPFERANLIHEHPELAKEMKKIAENNIKREIEINRIRTIAKAKLKEIRR